MLGSLGRELTERFTRFAEVKERGKQNGREAISIEGEKKNILLTKHVAVAGQEGGSSSAGGGTEINLEEPQRRDAGKRGGGVPVRSLMILEGRLQKMGGKAEAI